MRSLSSLHSQLLQRCQHLGRPLQGGRATAVKTYAVLETEITTVATPGACTFSPPAMCGTKRCAAWLCLQIIMVRHLK